MVLTLGILLLCQSWDCYAKVELPWRNWLCLPVGMAGMLMVYAAARMIMRSAKSRKRRRIVMGCLSTVMGALIFYVSAHYGFTPGWDPAFVYTDAYNLANGFLGELQNEYYSQYPNNLLLTLFYSRLYRLAEILGLSGQEYFLIHGFQSAGFGLTLYLTYLAAEKLTEGKHPDICLWCWVTGLLLVGISPWVAVQYTDSAALILVSVEGWVYLKTRENRHRPFWTGLLFLIAAVGFRVKPQTVILPIAAVLISLLGESRELLRKENRKKTGAAACAAVLGLGLGIGAVQWAFRESGYDLDPEAQLGITHYLKMGLNEEEMGGYSEEDIGTSAGGTRAERNRRNLEIIGERIRAMGIPGLWRQAVRKTLTNYGDGTFAWEQEGMFYSYETYYFRAGNRWFFEHVPPFYISGEYEDLVEESYSEVWRILCQCVWLAVLTLGLFSYGRRTDPETAVLQLAILGLTLFDLLFEARARYLFSYVPAYVLMAGIGLQNLIIRMEEHGRTGRSGIIRNRTKRSGSQADVTERKQED